MSEVKSHELTAESAGLLELGVVLGQNYAFGLVAGRCSAAQAEAIRRVREEKLFKSCTEKWDDFCPRYLKMSRSEADRTIKILEEFGPAYFEISQLTRVSPDTFRAIAPAIDDGFLHHNGEAIELNPENSRKVAAAVADLRRAIPPKSSETSSLMKELQQFGSELNLTGRIDKLDKCGTAYIDALRKIAAHEHLGDARMLLSSLLSRVCSELSQLAAENGLA